MRIWPESVWFGEKFESLVVPENINERWSMNFMHDQLADGHNCWLLNVIDNFNREILWPDKVRLNRDYVESDRSERVCIASG